MKKVQSHKDGIVLINRLKKDLEFKVSDGESKTFVIFLTDGKDQIGDLKIIIDGKAANVQILGVILGYGTQNINLYSLQDHLKPESASDFLIKTVLFDRARFHYQGLIRIEKCAQKSNAYLKNQNLIMSKSAKVNSRPFLEIQADDVHCTHGVTIGKIDKDKLYYLATRGLDQKSASKLLIMGFLSVVLDRIPDDSIRHHLQAQLVNKIDTLIRNKNINYV